MFQRYSKILDIIENFINALLIFLLASSFLTIFAQVILRYFFRQGYPWMEEYSKYTIIWLSLLGSAVALRHSKHMRLDILDNILNSKAVNIINFIFNLLLIAFFIIMVKSGYMYVIDNGKNISAGLPIKMAYVYFSMPVGMFLLIIYTVEKIWADIITMKSNSKSANKLGNGEVS